MFIIELQQVKKQVPVTKRVCSNGGCSHFSPVKLNGMLLRKLGVTISPIFVKKINDVKLSWRHTFKKLRKLHARVSMNYVLTSIF